MGNYMTVREVSDKIRVDKNTIRIWIREGKLKAVKAGERWKISETSLDNFLFEKKEGNNPYTN